MNQEPQVCAVALYNSNTQFSAVLFHRVVLELSYNTPADAREQHGHYIGNKWLCPDSHRATCNPLVALWHNGGTECGVI